MLGLQPMRSRYLYEFGGNLQLFLPEWIQRADNRKNCRSPAMNKALSLSIQVGPAVALGQLLLPVLHEPQLGLRDVVARSLGTLLLLLSLGFVQPILLLLFPGFGPVEVPDLLFLRHLLLLLTATH